MKKPLANIRSYLFANVLLSAFLLIGIWRGEPLWDATLRLPNILLFLMIINTVLLFREAIPSGKPRSKIVGMNAEAVEDPRGLLFSRDSLDEPAFLDLLTMLTAKMGGSASQVYLLDEPGKLNCLGTCGIPPTAFSAARLMVTQKGLVLKHPGNLGEEPLYRLGSQITLQTFISQVVHVSCQVIPLRSACREAGWWVLFPGSTKRSPEPNVLIGYLELAVACRRQQTQSQEGQTLDPVTGLGKFSRFQPAFEIEMERSERYQQQMTLLSLSICPPKGVREASATCRKNLAASLRESLRRLDLAFCGPRSHEFLAVLTETNPEVIRLVADRLLAAFQRRCGSDPDGAGLKLHIGAASYPADASHAEGLMEKSNEACRVAIEKDQPLRTFGFPEETSPL